MGSNLETLKGVYDAFAKGDVPAVLGAMDEKVDWTEPDTLPFEDQIGPQAVGENIFGPVVTAIQNFSATPEEYVDGGDVIVAIGRYRGTGAKTGVPLDAPFAHVWKFKNGKISYFHTHTDTKRWLDALGS